jgi:hypothetical protein
MRIQRRENDSESEVEGSADEVVAHAQEEGSGSEEARSDDDASIAEDESLSLVELVQRHIDDEIFVMKEAYRKKRLYRTGYSMQDLARRRRAQIQEAKDSIEVALCAYIIQLFNKCSKHF